MITSWFHHPLNICVKACALLKHFISTVLHLQNDWLRQASQVVRREQRFVHFRFGYLQDDKPRWWHLLSKTQNSQEGSPSHVPGNNRNQKHRRFGRRIFWHNGKKLYTWEIVNFILLHLSLGSIMSPLSEWKIFLWVPVTTFDYRFIWGNICYLWKDLKLLKTTKILAAYKY